jgi:hypothetical protein
MRYTEPTTNEDLRQYYLHHGGYILGQLRLPLSMVCGLQLLCSSLCTAPYLTLTILIC